MNKMMTGYNSYTTAIPFKLKMILHHFAMCLASSQVNLKRTAFIPQKETHTANSAKSRTFLDINHWGNQINVHL